MLSSITSSERPRVLVVDDNAAMLARASAALTSSCTIVATVTSGEAAVDAVRKFRPDIIVLDISMPGMTGFEVAVRLRQAGSKAALVFLTIHADEEFVVAAKAVGAIGYVVKARLGSDLAAAVRAASAGRTFVSALH
jgi:DNA-binding NarL/FixJ family response regulator